MCLSLALVCSEVDGIVVIYLWPPSFAYSKILTRGRYLSRHSRCLRVTRYSERFSRRAASTFSRSIATRGLRDGCLHAVAATTTGAAPLRRRGEAAIQSTKCRGHRRQPLEVHEEPLPVLHLLDEPAVAEPANFISIFALGVLLGGAPPRALKPVGVLDLDVPARERFSRRAASTFSRSIATKGLRDGSIHAAAATATPAPRRRGERAALRHRGSVADTDNDLLKYMNSPCRFCTFSTSPESLNQLISSPYSPWAYSSAERHPAHWKR